jgi:hypothetical protein
MKKTLKAALGGAALAAFFFLVITHFTSCGSQVSDGVSTRRIRLPVPLWPHDTSTQGSGTGAHPVDIIYNNSRVPAGSVLVVECANCGTGAKGSGLDAAPGSTKILFELSIPNDLPENTEMSLHFLRAAVSK